MPGKLSDSARAKLPLKRRDWSWLITLCLSRCSTKSSPNLFWRVSNTVIWYKESIYSRFNVKRTANFLKHFVKKPGGGELSTEVTILLNVWILWRGVVPFNRVLTTRTFAEAVEAGSWKDGSRPCRPSTTLTITASVPFCVQIEGLRAWETARMKEYPYDCKSGFAVREVCDEARNYGWTFQPHA
jgi:hypothetical protein